jgi:predicted unusual protein kinase regulating ubiquinone biosynthesis (AarF/ABC1/UbiB family)
MEWIEGCKLTDVEGLLEMHIHPRDVAIELLHAFAQMAFVDGFGELPFGASSSSSSSRIS